MIGLFVRRLLGIIPTVFIVTLGVFLLLSLVPGDPALTIASAGGTPTPEYVEEVRDRFHLEDSTIEQYGRWLGGVVRLDFGESFVSGESVFDEIKTRFPVTFSLALAGTIVALVVGIPLGLYSGMRPNGAVDRFARAYSALAISIPSFFLAIILVVLFAVQRKWLPSSGWTNLTESPFEWVRFVALPAITLGVALAAVFSRQLRASIVDVLESKFVQAAWARGGASRTVIGRHALKNGAIAPITVLGLQFGYLLGGTVIIEQIFGIPGLGAYMLRAIINLDLPVIQGVTLVFVITQIVISLLIDLSYGYLNPKVRVT